MRDSLVAQGPHQCLSCGTSSKKDGHDSEWLSLNRAPALIQHGDPEQGEFHMYISGYCGSCYFAYMFETGLVWQREHPELTTAENDRE